MRHYPHLPICENALGTISFERLNSCSVGYSEPQQSAGASDGWTTKQQMQQLEQALWLERCLNQLIAHLNHCFVADLGSGLTAWETRADQIEAAIFQTLIGDLELALDGGLIAIALPASQNEAGNSLYDERPPIAENKIDIKEESNFKIRYIAPTAKQFLPDRGIVAVLPNQVRLEIGREIAISAATLQRLQSEEWQCVWPIALDESVLAWLIVLPVSLLHWYDREVDVDPYALPWQRCLLERAVRHCAIAVHQTRLLQTAASQQQRMKVRQQELLRANELKSEFLANTSHEIRTPLSSILGFTQLLQEQGYTPSNLRHQEYLQVILSSGKHLLGLINDILDLSKIEANQLDLQWDILPVDDLCESALMLVKEKAYNKGLALKLDLKTDTTTLVADSLRLKQMLFNLLSNALKFTAAGSVGLRVDLIEDYFHFTVWDTGPGISEEQQAQLFKPYAQIAHPGYELQEGTGLGLALTQKLAECHGGWVMLESIVGEGSQFTIVLPRIPTAAAEQLSELTAALGQLPMLTHDSTSANDRLAIAPQKTTNSVLDSKSLVAKAPFKPKSVDWSPISPSGSPGKTVQLETDDLVCLPATNRILLVEDHVPNATLIVTYLCKLGYEISWVKRSQEMWQALQRSRPALILMDIQLPGTDGLKLIEQIRACEDYRGLPIVAQTALAMKGDQEICLNAGATDYISKPIDLERLGQLVEKYSQFVQE